MSFDTGGTFAAQGWQCPKCQRIYAPSMIVCPYCAASTGIATTDTTTYTSPSPTPDWHRCYTCGWASEDSARQLTLHCSRIALSVFASEDARDEPREVVREFGCVHWKPCPPGAIRMRDE